MKQKSSSYMDRAMKHRDPRYARVLGKLGHYPSVAVTDNLETVPSNAREHPDHERISRAMAAGKYNIVNEDGSFTHIDTWPIKPVPKDEREPVEATQRQPERKTAPVKPAEAAAIQQRGESVLAKRGRKPKTATEKKSDTTRRYKRRDMKAED